MARVDAYAGCVNPTRRVRYFSTRDIFAARDGGEREKGFSIRDEPLRLVARVILDVKIRLRGVISAK